MRYSRLLALLCCTALGCQIAPLSNAVGPKKVLLDDREVHYSVAGSGAQTLLLIHGWASDRRAWWKNAPQLAAHFRVIAIDLPGHGQSDDPARPYTMGLFADAMAAVLDAEGVAIALVVAHSNGVPTARQFYRQFPERVSKLVLVDGTMKSLIPDAFVPQVVASFENDYQGTVRTFVNQMPTHGLSDAELEAIMDMATSQTQGAVLGGFQAGIDSAIWNDDPIHVPVLMLQAKQPAWDAAYETYVRSLITNLDYRVLPDVSHYLMVEKADEFTTWVREFAARP
ncbi:MAG: alpha/beta hydrolase [Planctomycetota bacterium]